MTIPTPDLNESLEDASTASQTSCPSCADRLSAEVRAREAGYSEGFKEGVRAGLAAINRIRDDGRKRAYHFNAGLLRAANAVTAVGEE